MNRTDVYLNLALCLHALSEEAKAAKARVIEGRPPDLLTVQKAWDLLLTEVCRLDNQGE